MLFRGSSSWIFDCAYKKGVYCGNNNGNCVGAKEDLEEIIDQNLDNEELVQEAKEE